MFQKQTFENNTYMKMIRWVYLFLMLNVACFVINLPFFLAINFLAIDPRNLLFFGVATIPVGVAVITGFAAGQTFLKEGDFTPVKEIGRNLKLYGSKGILYGGLACGIGIVLALDSLFLLSVAPSILRWVLPLFVVLFVLAIAIATNACYFQVCNPRHSWQDVLKISGYYAIKKWYFSVINVVLIGTMLLVMLLKPQYGFLVTPMLFIGLCYLNCRQLV